MFGRLVSRGIAGVKFQCSCWSEVGAPAPALAPQRYSGQRAASLFLGQRPSAGGWRLGARPVSGSVDFRVRDGF